MFAKVYRYLIREIRTAVTGKPYFLNYPTATLCNHKCVMCNVWKLDKSNEIEPKQLEHIITDPLFSNIESIGLSGGEPFMRKNLTEVVSILTENLKMLKHFSINSNGNMPKRLASELPVIRRICKEKNVQLNLVLSLDGIGAVHNKCRGVENAFENFEKSLDIIKSNGMKPSILMTVHRANYHDIFNVFYYCIKNNITPYFGIATIIERLFNEESYNVFKLETIQKYYIWEFLSNLSKDPCFPMNKRIWYSLLADQLVYEGDRKASCVAQYKGVFLSDSGQISYCAVYNKELEKYNHTTISGQFFDKRNRDNIRNKMIEKHCNKCMHDYQSKPRLTDILKFYSEKSKFRQIANIAGGLNAYLSQKLLNTSGKQKKEIKNVVIYGWYGTETIGDKAILASIVNTLEDKYKNISITIASTNTTYTELTALELNFKDIRIISYQDLFQDIQHYDLFIFGGGPIMNYSDMFIFYKIASKAKKTGATTMIFGAGYGPLHSKLYKFIADEFIKVNDIRIFRNSENDGIDKNITDSYITETFVDPAYIWAAKLKRAQRSVDKRKTLGVSFRKWPKSSFASMDDAAYTNAVNKQKQAIAESIDHFINEYDGEALLIPMNTFYKGGDDRVILSEIYDMVKRKDRVTKMTGFHSPYDVIDAIDKCDVFIGMRFHSTVLSMARLCPTIGIDYIVPSGKISAFFNSCNMSKYVFSISDIDTDTLKNGIEQCLNSKDEIVKNLMSYMDRFTNNFDRIINEKLK